jgi:hypothetical protein
MSVRWDAVVDRSRMNIAQTPPPARGVVDEDVGCIQVEVRLFGALASVSAERLITLELPARSTIADVIAPLCERLGEQFEAAVLDETQNKRSSCRLFVDGVPFESLRAPLRTNSQPTQIEIILLVAPEGG